MLSNINVDFLKLSMLIYSQSIALLNNNQAFIVLQECALQDAMASNLSDTAGDKWEEHLALLQQD